MNFPRLDILKLNNTSILNCLYRKVNLILAFEIQIIKF